MVTVAVSRSFLRLHSAMYTRQEALDPTLLTDVQWRRASHCSTDTGRDSEYFHYHHYDDDWDIGKDLPRL